MINEWIDLSGTGPITLSEIVLSIACALLLILLFLTTRRV